MGGGYENEQWRTQAKDRDPMLDAIECPECIKEFMPKKPGQKTCGRPACAGAKGARLRDYKAKKIPGGKKARP